MRAALLSVSLVIGSQTAISPALPAMVEQFSDQSRNAVESLTTIQCLPIILMVMASALLAERFGKKRVVAFGVALSAIAGTVCPCAFSMFRISTSVARAASPSGNACV